MLTSDQELLERWISHQDAEAFKNLSSRYAGMVFATCRRILGNDADAEDVAQECFVSLVRADNTPGAYLGPWLHRVATNLSLNWIRTESRRRNRESSQKATQQNVTASSDSDILALVDEAIAKLPESQRSPVIAYFFEDQTQESIAKNLGLTRQGAANRISTGVESIRKNLSRQGITTGAVSLTALLTKEASATPPPSLSVALGKLAITGSIATKQGAASTIPVFGFLASNIKVAASVGALLLLIVALSLWRSAPSQSPSPLPVPTPITDSQPTNSEDYLNPGDEAINPSTVIASADEASALKPDPVEAPTNPTENVEKEANSLGTVFVSGKIYDKGAFPIPGATVSIITAPEIQKLVGAQLPNSPHTTSTNSDGIYHFDKIPASYVYLSASADGYKTESKRMNLEAGQTYENLEFVLSQGVMLRGVVLTETGFPISGAIVSPLGSVESNGSGSGLNYATNIAITNEAGLFSVGFRGEGRTALKISSSGGRESVFSDISIGANEPYEFRIGPAPSLSGTISNQDGSPATNMRIQLNGQFSVSWTRPTGEPGSAAGGSDSRRATTDQSGFYEFPQVVANTNYFAVVETQEGESMSASTELGAFESGEAHTWNFTLKPMIRVFGTVTGEQTGKPITNVRISYLTDGIFTEGSHLFNDNHYELRFFEPDTYYIFPEFNTWARNLTIEKYGVEVTVGIGDEREVNFKLPDSCTLAIRVIDSNGNPIQGAKANWYRNTPNGTGTYGSGQTDTEGHHTSEFVPNVESWFYVQKEGYTSVRSTPIVGEPAEAYPEETVVLYPSGGIEGVLVDTNGQPLSNARIKVAHRAEGVKVDQISYANVDSLSTTTDANGAFAMGDGFPAVTGDVHIEMQLDNNDWSQLTIIENVDVLPRHVTHIGTALIPPQ